MGNKLISKFVFFIILFFGVTGVAPDAARGEFILKIKKGVIDMEDTREAVSIDKIIINSESIKEINEKCGLLSVKKLFSVRKEDESANVYLFKFSERMSADEIIALYEKNEDVIYIEPNYKVRIQ